MRYLFCCSSELYVCLVFFVIFNAFTMEKRQLQPRVPATASRRAAVDVQLREQVSSINALVFYMLCRAFFIPYNAGLERKVPHLLDLFNTASFA